MGAYETEPAISSDGLGTFLAVWEEGFDLSVAGQRFVLPQ
jgi:hypothetical protein